MNTLIKNFCFFMIPILLIGISIEVLIRNIPNDYSHKKNYLDENATEIEILFLGSSHAYRGINPVYIPANSFNASYVSQSLYYDFKILEKYQDNWTQLRYIVIPVSYFSLFTNLDDSPESWRIKNYSIYYSIKTSYQLVDYSELLSNRLDINIERIYNFYLAGQTNITCSELGWGELVGTRSDLAERGKKAAIRHTAENDVFFKKNIQILESIIKFAGERDIQVVFYTPPALEPYIENLNDGQLSQTVLTMAQLSNNHPNVLYINFLTSNSFDKEDFYDADHLNKAGAQKLTLELIKLLNINNIDQ